MSERAEGGRVAFMGALGVALHSDGVASGNLEEGWNGFDIGYYRSFTGRLARGVMFLWG